MMQASVPTAMTPEESVYTMRLNRFLARSGVASRRKSDELIASGLVRVNGEVVAVGGCDRTHSVRNVSGQYGSC